MSKKAKDIIDDSTFVPKTDNQHVVLDYLEALFEDPELIAISTEEELKAIGAVDIVSKEVPENPGDALDLLADVGPDVAARDTS
ncbi:MAG: hypothetical protein ACPGPF_09875, partial [Pontibacterium sp.]